MDPEGKSDRVACEKAFNSTAACEDEAGRVRGLREHSVSPGHQTARKRVSQMSGTEFCAIGINPTADFPPDSQDINRAHLDCGIVGSQTKNRVNLAWCPTHKLVSNKRVSFKAAKSVAVCYRSKKN